MPVAKAATRKNARCGQVRTTPAVDGRALDVAATVQALVQNGTAVAQNGQIPLVMQPVAPAITDVSGLVVGYSGLSNLTRCHSAVASGFHWTRLGSGG